MIEISVKGLCKYFGVTNVFDDINFEVQTGERVGLIGRNGTGKTTVFKIIAGLEQLDKFDKGSISIRKDATIGYLDQIPQYPKGSKTIDVLKEAFNEVTEVRDKMMDLEKQMMVSDNKDIENIMKKYGELQHLFEHMGGYEIDEKVNKISIGLKISDEMKQREFNTLSGGEKTTILLGKILLQSPDILLLDEPTNHLDVESIEWLEDFLWEYKGTVIIVSHDRYFLDKVVTKIIEIEDGETSEYLGNYSYYIEEKDRRLLEQFEAFKDQQKKIKAMEEAIKRFREWGTRSDDPKMFKKAENMRKRIEKMEKVDKPTLDRKKIQVDFSSKDRSGNDVVYIEGLTKAFDSNIIIDNIDFHLRYREKLALLGKNGSGKSTLIRIILGQYEADQGEVKLGSNVKIGYLQQDIVFENEEDTILDVYRGHFNYNIAEGPARAILAKFLFYGSDVFKKVKNLSGGEKVRLKLCILMQENINLLILDEPTNHLDIESREMLEEALEDFKCTILFISHDRYFINKIAQRVAEIEDAKLMDYHGGYNYYKEKKQEKINQEKIIKEEIASKKVQEAKKTKIVENPRVDEEKKREKKLLKLEEEISKLEALVAEKDIEMNKYATENEKLSSIYKEKSELEEELQTLMEEWLVLQA